MQKEFLALYHDELQIFRRRTIEFSQRHPEAASKLRLADGLADDPHVERLIESFAFTAARIRHKLEDRFPELSAGLLDTLYPHLLAPRPSMGLVTLVPPPDLTAVQCLPRGFELLSDDINGDKCRFRTTQTVNLIPAKIKAIRYETDMQVLSLCPFKTARSALILSLTPLNKAGNLAVAGLKTIRFYLAGAWEQASLFYMHIFANATGLSFSDAEGLTTPLYLTKDHIEQAGFSDEESLLPPSPHFHSGLRLLSEFFALKRKFLFFDVTGLDKWSGKTLELTVYFDQQDNAFKKNLSPDSITLNTTPIINLFRQRCEPVHVNGKREKYHLVPDYRFRQSRKFHSVDCVTAISDGEPPVTCYPVYHAKAHCGGDHIVWQIIRDLCADNNDDCLISFNGSALDQGKPFVTRIDALCTNGQLPNQLPYSSGSLQLLPATPHSAIASVHCLMPFTTPVAQPLSDDQLWRFIAHLRLNHLSAGSDKGNTLREILRLYQTAKDVGGQKFIDAIQSVTPHASLCQIRQGGFATVTDFNIHFCANVLSPAEIFIFSCILNQFLQLYTSLNSVSRVSAWMENRAEPVASFPFQPCLRHAI